MNRRQSIEAAARRWREAELELARAGGRDPGLRRAVMRRRAEYHRLRHGSELLHLDHLREARSLPPAG